MFNVIQLDRFLFIIILALFSIYSLVLYIYYRIVKLQKYSIFYIISIFGALLFGGSLRSYLVGSISTNNSMENSDLSIVFLILCIIAIIISLIHIVYYINIVIKISQKD